MTSRFSLLMFAALLLMGACILQQEQTPKVRAAVAVQKSLEQQVKGLRKQLEDAVETINTQAHRIGTLESKTIAISLNSGGLVLKGGSVTIEASEYSWPFHGNGAGFRTGPDEGNKPFFTPQEAN